MRVNRLWEEAKGRASKYAGISTKFPKEAGAMRPKIWRQKSDFALKSTEKKAPAEEGTRIGPRTGCMWNYVVGGEEPDKPWAGRAARPLYTQFACHHAPKRTHGKVTL